MAPDDTPTPEHVADAFLHLARLAAAHANYGVTFIEVENETPVEHPVDEESLRVLAKVTVLLRRDRERGGKRISDVLLARVHAIMEEEFARVRRERFDPEAERLVEDRIEARLRDELGVSLSAQQKNGLGVDEEYIRGDKGPSNAAAEILGRMLGLRTGRTVYTSRDAATKAPPVPAPLNRWVSLRKVGGYMRSVLDHVATVRKCSAMLPFEALRGTAHLEPLMERVEDAFKKRHSDDLERHYNGMIGFFLALLRGENPLPGHPATKQEEEQWARLRDEFQALRAQLPSSPGSDEAVAREAAAWWVAQFKKTLDIY